jgi:hypothetical protein
MKAVIAAVILALATLCSPAHAWNCSNPLAERVLVPAGTTGTFGDGDGQLAMFNGQLYVCKVVPPSTPSTGGNSSANTNTNNNSSSSNSSSTSGASSTSNSGSTSSATGGKSNSTSTATGGNATGGNATGGSGYSGVANSGNSTSTNNNTATGGQGGAGGTGGKAVATGGNQSQTQTSTSAASNNGNGANNSTYSSTTNVAASKIPVASAVAPPSYPTATCFKGFSAAAQSMAFGASFGGGKIDENCARLEAARAAKNRLAFCKVYISDKYVRQAGVTLDDCMAQDEQITVEQSPATVVPEPAPVQPIVVNVPAPVVQVIQPPAPTVVAPTPIAPELKKKSVRRVHPPCYTNEELERMGVPHNKLTQ